MKSRLSAMKYIKNNKRASFVLILALALTFMAMYVVAFCFIVTIESFKPFTQELPKKIIYVNLTPESLGVDQEDFEDSEEFAKAYLEARSKFSDDLEALDGISKVYYTQVLHAEYKGIVGDFGYSFPLVEPSEVPFIANHLGAKLIDGRFPEGDGEIVVDEHIMKNNDMKIGDWFLRDNYGEVFKVVGVLRSDNMAVIGTPNGFYNNGWYHVILCNEKNAVFSDVADKLGITLHELDDIDDLEESRKTYDEKVVDVVETVIDVVILVIMIFLTIAVIVAYISFMRNRVNEYCLYASIGYGRSDIYGMMIREMLLIFGIGIAAGVLLSILLAVAINKTLIDPKGLVGHILYGDRLYGITATYVIIMGILQLPVLLNIRRLYLAIGYMCLS